jgi:GNAT superfamily N-acetyltransferase
MTSGELVLAARALWGGLAGSPWTDDGVHVRVAPASRLCPDGFVGVVTIGAGALVTVPDEALLDPARAVVLDAPVADLTDPATWRDLVPDVLLGPARLAYARPGDLHDGSGRHPGSGSGDQPAPPVELVAPDDAGVRALLAEVPPDEADESGVDGVTSPTAVERDDAGRVVAAAGWVAWPGGAAHVCVLVAPEVRGRGAAVRVGRAAVAHAWSEGRLVQWRARPGPSVSVARRLGLQDLGAQLSLRPSGRGVSDPSPGPPR